LCFAIRHNGEPLVTWEYAQKHMAWGLFYLFAGGAALGEILSQTGTAQLVADMLMPFAGAGGLRAVVVFSLMTIVITQITNNTAAAAIILVMAYMWFWQREYIQNFITSPQGHFLLVVAVILQIIGSLWVLSLIRADY
jgi:di/tricarboxylate transporter